MSLHKQLTRMAKYGRVALLCGVCSVWYAGVAKADQLDGARPTVETINRAVSLNDGNSVQQQTGEAVEKILKAVNPDGTDASRVSTRVKDLTRTIGYNWARMFNISDSNREQLPFADEFLGGYFRHFFNIFLDKQTDRKVQETNYDNIVKLQDDLVAGDNQFNMNASGTAVSLAVDDLYSAIKQMPRRDGIKTTDSMQGVQPVNLLTSSMTKGSVIADFPNSKDLVGPARYNDDQQKRAAMFVRSILGGVDIMSDVTIKYNNGNLTVYVPSSNGGQWYNYSVSKKEYDKFRESLDKLKIYQEFKVKQLASNALRSLYTANMVDLYGSRVPQVKVKNPEINGSEQLKSITELEDEVAKIGLDKKYLEGIKNGTVADFQVEMLATLNRIVYFLNKIHRDEERVSLAMSAAAIRLAAPDTTTDLSYYTPIGNWMKNRCWNNPESSECKNLRAEGSVSDITGQ